MGKSKYGKNKQSRERGPGAPDHGTSDGSAQDISASECNAPDIISSGTHPQKDISTSVAPRAGRLQRSLFGYLGFFVSMLACIPFIVLMAFVGGAVIGRAHLTAGTLASGIVLTILFGLMSALFGFLAVRLSNFCFRHNQSVVAPVTSGAISFWLLVSVLYGFSIFATSGQKAPSESISVLVGCLVNALSQYLTMRALAQHS